MDFRNVLNILMDAMEKTKSLLEEGYQFRFGKLRSTVYRVVSLWCSTLKEGSHCEIISEAVIKEIITDLMPRSKNCSLAPIKRDTKRIGEIFSMLDAITGNENDNIVRQQAYFCLQQLLSSSGHMIKKSVLKDVYNTILDISIQMHSKQMTKLNSSITWSSRLEVDKLLMFLLKLRICGCPAPGEIIISLLGAFRLCNNSVELSQNVYFEALEQMVHFHKSDIFFKKEFTDIYFFNSNYENERLSRTEKKTLSKICSQLPSNQQEVENKLGRRSQNNSKYDILDSYCSSKADLMMVHERELNIKGHDNNSLNRSITFGNGSKPITVTQNRTILIPLNNELKNFEQNEIERRQIFDNSNLKRFEKNETFSTSDGKLRLDDIMIAELEATFVSELK